MGIAFKYIQFREFDDDDKGGGGEGGTDKKIGLNADFAISQTTCNNQY